MTAGSEFRKNFNLKIIFKQMRNGKEQNWAKFVFKKT